MVPQQETTTHSTFLRIYLQDHYAASTGGLALFRRSAASQCDAAIRARLGELAAEVAEDRTALRSIMRSVGVEPARTKSAMVWVGEKAGRLKLNGRLFQRSPLSDVLELEALATAVNGKLRGWNCLRLLAENDPRVEESRIRDLINRAERQVARLDDLHRDAISSTLT